MPALAVRAHPSIGLLVRLVEIARAQAAAIESWDLDSFVHLLAERATVQRAVEHLDLNTCDTSVETLQRVAEIDRENIGRVTSMIEETSRSLDKAQRGKIMLNGAGLRATEPVSEAL